MICGKNIIVIKSENIIFLNGKLNWVNLYVVRVVEIIVKMILGIIYLKVLIKYKVKV